MFCMNHTERKINSVFGANHPLSSALNSWMRKLRQPIGMVGIRRPMADATDSLQAKNWQNGLWGKAWEQGVLHILGTFQQEGKNKGSNLNRLLRSPWDLQCLVCLPCGDDSQLIMACLDSDWLLLLSKFQDLLCYGCQWGDFRKTFSHHARTLGVVAGIH